MQQKESLQHTTCTFHACDPMLFKRRGASLAVISLSFIPPSPVIFCFKAFTRISELVMDPVSAFGVATGVIGLIPLCAQGFNMIVAGVEAPKAVKESMTKITVQRILFINWGNPMGVGNASDKIAVDKLMKRIPNWEHIGPGVLEILTAMSDMFADVKTLESTYGMRPSKEVRVYLFHPMSVQLKC